MAANRPISPTFGDSLPRTSAQPSGFTPLPPIRRTSTFDLMSRNRPDEDEDGRASPAGPADDSIPPPPIEKEETYLNGNGQIPGRGQFNQSHNFVHAQQHSTHAASSSQYPNGSAVGGGIHQTGGAQQPALAGMARAGPVPGSFPVNSSRQPFVSQMGGNPIQKFPLGGQWKLEESHLSEPLIQHKNRPGANSPPQQHLANFAYDKETEDVPISKAQGFMQMRLRNNSGSIPPVSAERYRNLFVPHGPDQFQGQPPQPVGARRVQGQAISNAGQSRRGEPDHNKEMDVHVDEVSPSSEEHPSGGRRGSGFFSLSNRRNVGPEQSSENSDQVPLWKEKRSLFSAVTSHDKSQTKQKSNPGFAKTSTWDHDDAPESSSIRKRLSELRGMIGAVGNVKDGARDDQPAKPGSSYSSTPSLQGLTRMQTGGSQGMQAPTGRPGLLGLSSASTGRDSPSGPRPAHVQPTQGEDDREKKSGKFLGGLFNKQSSKPSESKPQQTGPQAVMPIQQSTQAGQHVGPGQYPTYAGQPATSGHLAVQNPLQSPVSPQFFGTAQAVVMRRPAEITVSQNQPGATQQLYGHWVHGSQANVAQPAERDSSDNNSFKRSGGDENFVVSGLPSKITPYLSERPSQDRLDIGGSSSAPRTFPSRKPVGSGPVKQDGPSTTPGRPPERPVQPTINVKVEGSGSRHQSPQDESRLSSHPPSGQQSPTLGKLEDMRHTSLPSPGHPPVPPLPSPANQRGSPTASAQPQVLSRGPPGASQPGQAQTPSLPSPSGPGPQQNSRQNPQVWAQQRPRAPSHSGQALSSKSSGGPAQVPDQQNTIAKFFGVDSKGKAIPGQASPATKEKSAAHKLLDAFKRGSKQAESHQHKPSSGRQTPTNMMRTQQSNQPQQPGRPMISGPSPAGPLGPMSGLPQTPVQSGQGRGQTASPPGPSGYSRMSPPMMHGAGAGRGQPVSQVQKPPQSQGSQPQTTGQPRRTSTQKFEPQYGQVPIPRGYEAVHGYGNAGMVAPSPYNLGRLSPPPVSHQQFQFIPRQGAPPQQPGNSYSQHPAVLQPGQQPVSTSSQSHRDSPSQTDSGTPTPSEQGTFLDMAPTPPPQSLEDLQPERQPNQNARPFQQPQTLPEADQRRGPGLDMNIPSSSNWGSAPASAQSSHTLRAQESLVYGAAAQPHPLNPNFSRPSIDIQRSQPQHIATAMSTQHPLALQPGPGLPPSLTVGPPSPAQAVDDRNGPTSGRLVSKMAAVANNGDAPVPPPPSFSSYLNPEALGDRATSVSPEPSGPRPYHQISSTSLNINIDRANDGGGRDADEDIYDATPRQNPLPSPPQFSPQQYAQEPRHAQMQMHETAARENTKYAITNMSRPGMPPGNMIGGVGALGGVAGTTTAVTADAASSTPVESTVTASSSTSSLQGSSPSQTSSTAAAAASAPVPVEYPHHHHEPEEKILVDQPAELAAVNDDDDGIPMMSATSYPGQEWNPYGAGEFGDWE
ncbi:hypothetical protein GGS23DRAFT_598854 [Durotheca rogersii]|uniref:uncharacterized protein n=1 Tax=Durotheca rogersii TaxID=419775 RepID=UPI00221FF587|nr:uncharacterized protein GGS23DRAFT_598854 [Durotheca rogersii]KAI5860967.1 hypothetical protein GGS23DRAFT_598854 [Durotheca rogersii]